jgi:undecaprenol kinase
MGLKDNTQKNKHFRDSLHFALVGIKTVYQEERNMRSHSVMAVLAVLAGVFFRLSAFEWLWIISAIFFVMIIEIVNTAFENVVDMVTDFHYHSIGKKIKDMAAGAVLLAACYTVIVAGIIFIPKIVTFVCG